MSLKSDLIAVGGKLGLFRLASLIARRHPRILMYHRFALNEQKGFISAACFERQLQYICRYYQPINLTSFQAAKRDGKRLPCNAVILTIDDGYHDFYDIAFPLLKKYKVPATLFVTTGLVNKQLWLWPDKVSWLLDNVGVDRSEMTIGSINLPSGLVQDWEWQTLIDFLLSVPDVEKHQYIEELARSWGLKLPDEAPSQYTAVSWDNLREMQNEGIEIGGHTFSHPSLGQVDKGQAEIEIGSCLEVLNKNLGMDSRPFCYPNGQPDDYSDFVMDLVFDAGFNCAVVAFADDCKNQKLFSLRRHASSENMQQFYKAVSGLEWLGFFLRNESRNSI